MKSIILFLIFCLSISLFAGQNAQWIVYPEELEDGYNKVRYFRTEIDVPNKEIETAYLFFRADDKLVDEKVYINHSGNKASDPVHLYHGYTRLSLYPDMTHQYDATLLKTGFPVGRRYAICAATKNYGDEGGFILHLLFTYKDGTIQEMVTDTTHWKTSQAVPDSSWLLPGFDDSGWETPQAAGDCYAHPWIEHFSAMPFLCHEDAEAERERESQVALRTEELREELAQEPISQAEIVYKDGGAFFDINGTLYRPVLYNFGSGGRDTPKFREKVRNFIDSDIKLISFGLEAGDFWTGPDTYDYEYLEKLLATNTVLAPEARFIFSITFSHGPKWWNTLHPQETISYARVDGKYPASDCIGNYPAPSYASELWKTESAEAIRKLVEYIENSPFGKHVFGYRIGSGVYSEWHYFGMANAMPDVSAPMVKLFRSFLMEKYHDNVESLRAAWNQPQVTFENALPPPVEERLKFRDDSLRDPVAQAWCIDFLQCIQRSLRDSLLTMNKAAKDASNGRALVGNYCGYFYGMGYTAEGWHIINDEFMDSPYVDFQMSPCCYGEFYRGIGRSQLARSLTASYRLHNKICIFEADGRTHLAPEGDGQHYCNSLQESIAMLSRDLAQAISKGSAYWYYDFGRDWYNCPEIFDFFHKIAPVYNAITDFSSSAEIAVIADWESAYYHAIQDTNGGMQHHISVNNLPRVLNQAGLQFDTFSFADLDNPVLQNYKIFIFPQLYYMTPEKQAKLSAIKNAGKTLIFLNTPGWLTSQGVDENSICQTTGIQATVLEEVGRSTTTLTSGGTMDSEEYPNRKYSPVLKVTDDKATILGTTKLASGTKVNGYAKKQNGDGSTTYLTNTPVISAAELRRIATEAGVHSYCDSANGVVYANNSMIAFHTGTPGSYTLKAKGSVKWKMVYPESQSYPNAQSELTFTASQPDTYIFVIEP